MLRFFSSSLTDISFELGYVYFNDRGPDSSFDAHVYPDLLLRQGMFADWFEFRLGWTYLSDREREGNVVSHHNRSSDLLVGAKIALTPQEGILPEMAIIPQMLVPISNDPILGGGEVLPGLNWVYAWDLSDAISMGGSTQMIRALDEVTGDPYGLFAQSWVFGFSLTERIGAYGEYFVLIPDGADTLLTAHFVNGGLTYLVNNDLQLDIRVGMSLSNNADDFFVGTGLSYRLPW